MFPSILRAAAVSIFRLYEEATSSGRGVSRGGGGVGAVELQDLRNRMTVLVSGHTEAMKRTIDPEVLTEIYSFDARMRA